VEISALSKTKLLKKVIWGGGVLTKQHITLCAASQPEGHGSETGQRVSRAVILHCVFLLCIVLLCGDVMLCSVVGLDLCD
jgi:hypothetical protein